MGTGCSGKSSWRCWAKEPSHGYQLRARLDQALGPLGEAINAGQIYVTLGRPEKAGLVARCLGNDQRWDRPDRKIYELTAAGQERVSEWLAELSWPKPDLAEFHLKLIAAAHGGLADPAGISAPSAWNCCGGCEMLSAPPKRLGSVAHRPRALKALGIHRL